MYACRLCMNALAFIHSMFFVVSYFMYKARNEPLRVAGTESPPPGPLPPSSVPWPHLPSGPEITDRYTNTRAKIKVLLVRYIK